LISLGFSEKIRFSQKQVHHGVTERTEREIFFFVHREIPIDEKNVSNQISEATFAMGQLSKTLDQQEYLSMVLQMEEALDSVFCLSVSLDKQKLFSVFSVPVVKNLF